MESSHPPRAGDWSLSNSSYPTSELVLLTGPQVQMQREVKVSHDCGKSGCQVNRWWSQVSDRMVVSPWCWSDQKTMALGLPWWSIGQDSMLPLQEARVRSLAREVSHAVWYGQKKKERKKTAALSHGRFGEHHGKKYFTSEVLGSWSYRQTYDIREQTAVIFGTKALLERAWWAWPCVCWAEVKCQLLCRWKLRGKG